MPITPASMRANPYYIGNFSGFDVKKTGEHYLYDWRSVRVKIDNIVPEDKLRRIAPAKDASGDTIYLSFFSNEISSVRLPAPPPAGVTQFLTDTLEGCTLFIDRIQGSQDLIVYHANALQHSPDDNLSRKNPAYLKLEAVEYMNRLYRQAQGHYQAAPHNLVLHDAAKFDKPRYRQTPDLMMKHEKGRRHGGIEFGGLTLVAGFAEGAGWQFYYQTWGQMIYKSPTGEMESKTEDRVLASGKFYP